MTSTAARAAGLAVVLVLTALLAVWGVFLVPLRVGGVRAPVGLVLAVAPYVLGRIGGDLLGRRLGVALPGVLWTGVVVVLAQQGPGGDLLVAGGGTLGLLGVGYLVLGVLAAAAAVGGWRPPAADPAPAQPGAGRVRSASGGPRG